MPKLRFDAGIRDVAIRIDQRLDDLARARWRETPVAGECDHEEARTRACKRLIESIAEVACRIDIVERLGDQQKSVGLGASDERLTRLAKVKFELVLHIQTKRTEPR